MGAFSLNILFPGYVSIYFFTQRFLSHPSSSAYPFQGCRRLTQVRLCQFSKYWYLLVVLLPSFFRNFATASIIRSPFVESHLFSMSAFWAHNITLHMVCIICINVIAETETSSCSNKRIAQSLSEQHAQPRLIVLDMYWWKETHLQTIKDQLGLTSVT